MVSSRKIPLSFGSVIEGPSERMVSHIVHTKFKPKNAKATKLPKATKEPANQLSLTFTFQLDPALKLCDNTSDGGTNPDLLCADDDDRPLTRWSWWQTDRISETAYSGFLKNSETNSYISSLNNDVQMVPENEALTWSIEIDTVGGINVLHPGQNFDLMLCASDTGTREFFFLAVTPKLDDKITDFNNVPDLCVIQTQI